MNTADQVRILATITTRAEDGRHFTEVFADSDLDALEATGLITIERPVHADSGIAYEQKYWSVEVTQEGLELVWANEEFWPAGA